MDDNHAPGLSIATALFFIWSVLTFAVRAWVKLRRSENWGLDDSTITGSLVVALCHVVAVFWAVHAGYGAAVDELSSHAELVVEKALYTSHYFYILSIGLSKVSTAFFIGHLTRHGPQVRTAYMLAAICGAWAIASMLVIGLRGNLSHPWTVVDGSKPMFYRWLGVEISGAVVEIGLWALSIHIIWGLSMSLSKRLLVLAIFGCRLLLIPLIVLRLYYLSPLQNADPQLPSMTASVLTEAALQFAFISASVTCLKPFLRPFHSSYVVSTVETGSTGYRSGNSRTPYYVLSTIGREKDGVLTSTDQETQSDTDRERGRRKEKRVSYVEPHVVSNSQTRRAGKNEPFDPTASTASRRSFRPDNVESRSIVEATKDARHHNRGAPSSSNPSARSEAMVIHKTESWSVRIETEEESSRHAIRKPSPALKGSDIGVALSPHAE